MTNPKPCPFCHGHATLSDDAPWTVECGFCGARSAAVVPSAEMAVALWNTRAAPAPVAVPEGMVLVPVELTPEMSNAWFNTPRDSDIPATNTGYFQPPYAAMLAAAPSAPASQTEAQSGDDILSRQFELNMSNYGPDDVDTLQAWALDAYDKIATLRAQLAERDEQIRLLAEEVHAHSSNEVDFAEKLAASEARVGELTEALEDARLFIRNGIELGFIRMPDADTPDPAHDTLPRIDAALSQPKGDSNEAK